MTTTTTRVAAVQATPVFLDREATVDKVCRLVAEAAHQGARLAVFPEAFVPGYPDWVWRAPAWDDETWFARLLDQAVVVPSADTRRIGDAARAAGIHVAIGVDEREEHGSTIYNSLLYFGSDGSLLAVHRKLMPTGGERLVWGMGDGSGLHVVDTPFGRVGGLICWENYMPLARAAMYAQGVDIWVAPTWDNSDAWVSTMRHIGKEGRLHVVGVAPCIRGSHIPASPALPDRDRLYGGEDDWLCRGLSVITGPDGEVLAGPLAEQEGLVVADIDVARARGERRKFDPVGHYARPDVFALTVDSRPRRSVRFVTDEEAFAAVAPATLADEQAGMSGNGADAAAGRRVRRVGRRLR